jgi:aldehyde:ferredoxin oxidoreductase
MGIFSGGYAGKILRINLTRRRVTEQKLPQELAHAYVGGRGFNVRLLYSEIKAGTAPLGPDNKIILGVGPCAGTSVPGSQRFNMTTKSPLTGFLGDSNSGGDLGAALKYAGYDAVIIEGQSSKPIYLFINDRNVAFKEAEHLWGNTTVDTRRIIERELNDPDVCVASIGPGGENLVTFANVMSELGRASGRTGIGAVLGSKKVKAIAASGSRGVRVAHYPALKKLILENNTDWLSDPGAYEGWTKYGPPRAWGAYAACGMLPTRNFQCGTFGSDLFEQLVKNNYLVKQKACISCPLGCNHSYAVRSGPYAGTFGEGLELDQLGDFGPKVGNEDMSLALKASTLVDEYGLDIMDMSALVAFAMECCEKGILSSRDFGGIKPAWGSPEAILTIIEMTAKRKGIGDVFARGIHKAAEAIGKGSDRYAMHVKGMSLVMRNVRASKGWALMYAISSRGACHMRAWLPEGYGAGGSVAAGIWDRAALKTVRQYSDPLNPLAEEGKAELVKWHEDLRALRDTLDICHFTLYKLSVDSKGESTAGVYARYIRAVTGMNLSAAKALRVGERVCNLERAFNVREGLNRSDDTLPARMREEPLPDGPSRGQTVNLEPMLNRYYEVRGWDTQTGFPTGKTLYRLGLDDVADDLERMGRLA